MLAGALVAYAVYEREVSLLIIAAVGALAAGVVAVVVFDVELIRARRAHGADRVAQARAYAAMYAAHVRVMTEGFALAEQRRRAAQAAASREVASSGPTSVDEWSAGTQRTHPSVASQLEPVVLAMATAGLAEGPAAGGPADTGTTTRETASEATTTERADATPRLVEAEATSAAEVQVDLREKDEVRPSGETTEDEATVGHLAVPIRMPATADDDDPAELWDTFDAPTVVDLMAWEVRARLAAEEERERQAEAKPSGGAEPTDGQGGSSATVAGA